MLNESLYKQGIQLNEILKYNINYNKESISDVVIKAVAKTLLEHEYNDLLTEEEKAILNNIVEAQMT